MKSLSYDQVLIVITEICEYLFMIDTQLLDLSQWKEGMHFSSLWYSQYWYGFSIQCNVTFSMSLLIYIALLYCHVLYELPK